MTDQPDSDQQDIDMCYIHGHEPLPEKYYRLCGECWHVFVTPEELMSAHAAILADMGMTVTNETADDIAVCPHCTHDF